MVALPTAESLPMDVPHPDVQPVSYPRQIGRPGALGQAVQDVGAGLKNQQDQADEFAYAKARAQFLTQKTDLESTIQDDPKMAQIASDAGDTIDNPKYRSRFDLESSTDTASGLSAVNHYVRGKQVDQGLGDLATLMEQARLNALANPKDAAASIATVQSALDGATAKGYITDYKNVQLRQQWLQDYGRGYLETLPDSQALSVLQKGLPAHAKAMQSGAPFTEAQVSQVVPSLFPGATITSTVRTPSQNASVGGVANSQHLAGTALDFTLKTPEEMQAAADKINAGAIPGARAIYEGPGAKNSTAPHVHIQWGGSATQPAQSDGATQLDATDAPITAKTGTPADFVDPAVRAQMLQETARRVKADSAIDTAQYVSTVQDSIDYLHAGGDPTQLSIKPSDIAANVPGKEGESLVDEYNHAIDFNHAATTIATANQSQVTAILSGHIPTGPNDFRANAQEFDYLQKAAQARQNAIYGDGKTQGDPAAYAVNAFKDVRASYANATKDPTQFAAYVQRLSGAYDTLGVPAQYRRVLPQADAQAQVTQIQTAGPQQAAQTLDALQKTAGKFWPQVYRDLAHAGLPASFQTITVASPADQPTMISAMQMDADNKANGKDPIEKQMQGVTYYDGNKAHSVSTGVTNALAQDANLQSLRTSFGVAGRPGVDQFNGVYDAIKTTAFYLYQKGGLTPEQAASKASNMITGQFDFVPQGEHPPTRLPKGTTQDFTDATTFALANLTDKDIQPYKAQGNEAGEPIDSTPQQLADAALQGAHGAYWLTVPGADGRGAVRAMDPQSGRPVILKSGQPLEIPFSKFSYLASQSRKAQATRDAMDQQDIWVK
jgi:uncharacterized protein YcbK (DUF882 family)